ncbi:MAG: T9SS type A sorting domain-containing protein [Agriterribacter sp.]
MFIFKGGETGITRDDPIVKSGPVNPEHQLTFCASFSGGGDINGDGLGDFLLGTPDNYVADFWGEAYIYYSTAPRARTGLSLYNTGTTTRIQQSNISNDQFSIGMFLKNPKGRSKGKLIWETKSEGEAFSSNSPIGNSTQFTGQQENYTNSGLAGTMLNTVVNKSGFATKIRARVKYDPVTSLNGQVYGPWVYPQGYFDVQGMNATPLPVTWLSFTAKPVQNNQKVQLDWQTGSENNNVFFSIERSANTEQWTTLKEIKGLGNSTHIQFYQSFDELPLQGKSYYRIKQIDADSKTTYSDTRSVYISTVEKISVYPVPATHTLIIEGNKNALQQLVIVNSNGTRQNNTRMSYSGANKALIDISKLTPGLYYLQTRLGTYKFIKQ